MGENAVAKGLGGWLILVGVIVITSPFINGYQFYSTYIPFFIDGSWALFTTQGLSTYNPGFVSFFLLEMFVVGSLTILTTYIAYLFFSHHYRFPAFFIGLVAFNLIWSLIDLGIASIFITNDATLLDHEDIKDLVRMGLACVIWIPYMLMSERVKATFIMGTPDADNNDSSTHTPAVEEVM